MTVEAEISGLIDKFAPPVRELIRSCRDRMARLFPDAVQLVYDNYNFFVIAFSPTGRASDALFSLAADRHGITLFFQRGTDLPDPAALLRGSGKRIRGLPLGGADDLERPEVRDLLDAAVELSAAAATPVAGPLVVLKSVSAKQRPRQ